MFLVDLETRKFLMCNAMCLQTLGYAQEEFLNLEISDIHPKDDLPLVFEQIAKFMKGEEGVRHDLRFRRKDGSLFFSDLSPSLVTLAGKKFILIVYKDITERIQIQNEKRQANEKLTVLVKKLEDRNYQNIILSEMREMLQACSTMEEAAPIIRGLMEKLFPNSEGALFIMSPSRSDLESVARWGDFPKDVDDNVFAPDACWALRRGRTYIVENVSVGPLCPHLKHPPSTAYMCLPLIAKGDVLGLLHLRSRQSTQIQSEQNVISDLKDMAVILSEYLSLSIANIQLNERLARESVRDLLTGLFNRRFMIESLEREIKRAERNQTQVGIIMADIDHFKQFNDKYGHAAGDKVLTQMGGFFKAGLRGSDVACRYGGEEFVFFLPECSAENTFKRADQMREKVKNLAVHYGGELLASITLSMGISTYPDQGSNAEDLLRVADAALYRAKQEGRDRVIIG
jgi:diguanylate cyclase (GGDEF)-like protein/PAS domain S-box-containing protein